MHDPEITEPSQNFDIAIIGMAGRFPGAHSLKQFWENIRNGVESITFFSDQDLAGRVHPTLLEDPLYVKAGAVLDDIAGFDATFFGYSPREAELMDPQQRFFLECAWEAFEHAGYHAETFTGPIGVYAGSSLSSYLLFNILPTSVDAPGSLHTLPAVIGNSSGSLTTRVSYKLNLRGPSVHVQTACSTSLVAVHLACQDLLNYRCDMALAGGVSINVEQDTGYRYEGGPLSPDGHCRTFDAHAQGTLRGNGVGTVVLKRLADALVDGDTIHGIIKGSAVNNDGSAKVGFTAPSMTGQTEVIREALAVANVDPATIGYVEAHGTATPLGDPIEVAALTQAYRSSTNRSGFCALGSVKTNIGHLDAAAGIAGLIKTILALKQKEIPPSLYFEQPNPEIDFAQSPFYVNTTLRPWTVPDQQPRRAAVSSFGFGGTNAHLILEEAPQPQASGEERSAHLLLLSAQTPDALEAVTSRLASALETSASSAALADAAYTLQIGRKPLSHRRILVCDENRTMVVEALRTQNSSFLRSAVLPEATLSSLIWILPGQGTQKAGVGLGLYRQEPLFRQHVDRCAEFLLPYLQGLDVRHILYPELFPADLAAANANPKAKCEWPGPAELAEPWLAQPALFVIEYALAQVWLEAIGRPQGLLGHSLGEYVVATLAGVLSLEDALKLVAVRGHLMQALPEGSMLALPLAEEALQSMLADLALDRPEIAASVSLAAVNAPEQSVLSGATRNIEALEDWLARKRPETASNCRRLTTNRAFHSVEMEPMLEPFARELKSLHWNTPILPYVSSVTGEWITTEQATNPDYWVQQVRQPVRFAQALNTLFVTNGEQRQMLIEIGPGQALSSLARRQPAYESERHTLLVSLPKMQETASTTTVAEWISERERAEEMGLLWALGNCWLQGIRVDWYARAKQERRQRVPLPAYPFEHQRFWVTPAPKPAFPALSQKVSSLEAEEQYVGLRSWKRSTLSSSKVEDQCEGKQRSWLLFADDRGPGQSIAATLQQTGHEVWLVKTRSSFERSGDRLYGLNPHKPGDYDLLINNLQAHGQSPNGILYLWNSSSVGTGLAPTLELSLLYLAQALTRHETEIQKHFWVVTNGAYEVTGDESLQPGLALAACRYLSTQSPSVICHHLDFCFSDTEIGTGSTVARHILMEISAETEDEIVAYRHGRRWLPTTEYTEYQDIIGKAGISSLLHQGGTHLIFGGLDSISFEAVTYLAQATQGKLLLVEKSKLPQRSEWSDWLTAGHQQKESFLTRLIKEERRSGLAALLEQEDGYLRDLEKRCTTELEVERFSDELEQTMNEMCTSYICSYLAENGIKVSASQSYDYTALREKLRIQPKFIKFFDFFIFCLIEDGIVSVNGQKITFLEKADQIEPATQMKARLTAQYPDFSAELNVLEHCATHYSQVFSGETEAISILFPDGTMNMLRPIAEKRISLTYAKIYLTMTAEFLARLVKNKPQKVVKILEVGGGEGFLTWPVIEKLKGTHVEYTFTDLGKSFVLNAERKARQEGLDWMSFGVLDISRTPQEQGYEEYAFDIILAYDVVHATANIKQTAQNMQRWLAPGGMMLFLEASRARRWSTMVWGLAEGWWYFEDENLRRHSPFLAPEKWVQVLESLNFRCVRAYPHNSEQQVLSDRALLVMQQSEEIATDDYQCWLSKKQREAYEEICFKIQQAQALERLGATIEFVPLEIVDQEQMSENIEHLCNQFGRLNSIVYALQPQSGRHQDTGVFSERSWKDLLLQIQRLLVLNGEIQQQSLDFALLLTPTCSSFSEEQAIHTAVESFSGIFVSAASRAGDTLWMNLCWLRNPQQEQVQQWCSTILKSEPEKLLATLQPAVQLLQWVFSLGTAAQILLAPYRLPQIPALRNENVIEQAPVSLALKGQSDKRQQGQDSVLMNETQRAIASIWESILGIKQLGINSNFFEMGGDSLLATQLISKVRDIYHVEIPLRHFFEQPTIVGLGTLVEKELQRYDMTEPSDTIQAIPREARKAKRSKSRTRSNDDKDQATRTAKPQADAHVPPPRPPAPQPASLALPSQE